ncbi:MAG: MBL fold metallo-hydrolase [Neomegalonema sp.]|nr:MBL fold metallo-hydrolase [Neomegalonema sp.]
MVECITIDTGEKMAPRIQRLLAPNASPMTYQGTNTYLVGDPVRFVIDPGPLIESHLREIERRAPSLQAVLVTHSHLDHSPGAAWLKEQCGATIMAFGAHGAGMSPAMRALAEHGVGGGEGADTDFAPDEELSDGDILSFGIGVGDVRALHTPGHLSNHLCFALEQSGIVFSGDHVMGWASSLVSPPDGDMGAFMKSIERLQEREDRLYLPGHGDPIPDPQARLKELYAHRRSREAQILEALRAEPATPTALVRRLYQDVPAALHPMAERNVLAHLIDLSERGLTRPRGTLTPQSIFVPV